MPSLLHFRPPAVTCVATVSVLTMFCFDGGLSFIGSATPAHRKSLRFEHQLFVSSLPRELAVQDPKTYVDLADVDLAPPDFDLAPPDALQTTLVPLNFEADIREHIDIDRPYYALQNECSIEDATGESQGFVCTVKREMPISREGGGISMGEVGRHSAAAATVAASLIKSKNGINGRFHYLASEYSWKVRPAEDTVRQELSTVFNRDEFAIRTSSDPDECTIFCRCHEVTKRYATVEVYFESEDDLYYLDIKFSIVAARVFKSLHASRIRTNDQVSINHNPYHEDIIKMSRLKIGECFNDCLHDDWVTVEASLDAIQNCDCIGHFYEGCARATPHSIALFHNVDLIGQAISKLTGRNIPYKKSPEEEHVDDTWCIQMVNWRCTPENLNFADTEGLSLQVKAFLSDGRLGETGSKYSVQCSVGGVESGTLSYTSTGIFVLYSMLCTEMYTREQFN